MSLQFNLRDHQTVSNSETFTDLVGIYPDNIPFDIQLRIDPHRDGFFFLLFGPAVTLTDVQGISKRSEKEIFLLAEECRKKWTECVVSFSREASVSTGGIRAELPFQEEWHFSKPDLLKQAAPQLALAGNRLFELIFETKSDDDLKEFARVLREILAARPRYVAITSDKFFVPWGLLYTHPSGKLERDGSNWKEEGFWGYQHIIQHNPLKTRSDPKIKSKAGAVPISINFNEKITAELTLSTIARTFIEEHFELIAHLGGCECIKRKLKKELAKCFSEKRELLERIIYFYCHGQGSTDGQAIELGASRLILTDDPIDPVSAEDFQLWAKDIPLHTQPLIFINACQGGHMTTMFYRTLAFELLRQGAVGVVGAQVDIPAVFAAAYARCIFENFFQKGNGRIRLGPLLRETNQRFWEHHHNPLGLVYSLYRGVDCFIDWNCE
jgi:hypothetical protein